MSADPVIAADEYCGDGAKIDDILRDIFHLMDTNGDEQIDQEEGVAVSACHTHVYESRSPRCRAVSYLG